MTSTMPSLLVARGFVQLVPGLILALAAQEGWRVHHMDVKSAFLNSDLKEEVYVHHPPGFVIPSKEAKVLRLRKALYGLRQAPRGMEHQDGLHAQGDGLRAKPARGRHLPAGQWW